MKSVIDSTGKLISGLFRKSDGSLSVIDNDLYNKYKLELKRASEIEELKDKITRLESIVNSLLNKI